MMMNDSSATNSQSEHLHREAVSVESGMENLPAAQVSGTVPTVGAASTADAMSIPDVTSIPGAGSSPSAEAGDGLERERLFGIPYVVADLPAASEAFVRLALHTHGPRLIAHSDVHVLTRMLHEEDYGRGMQNFDAICPDGMPLVWLLRRKGRAASRLYGPDMMEWMWKEGRGVGLRHFLLGGSEESIRLLQQRLGERYPGVQIAGHYCPPMPPWPEGEDERILAALRESGAHCIWVGLGCPRQERWLYTHKSELPPGLYFGVGAAFNFHAGLVRQAPRWVRRCGLEWLFRLACEPRRLFRRYLVHNTRFLLDLITRRP